MEKPNPEIAEKSIKETLEAIEYANKIMDGMVSSKKDDGKITTLEIGTVLLTTAPAGLKAYMGSSEIDDELADLDDEEMRKVAFESSKLVKKILLLVHKKEDASEEK